MIIIASVWVFSILFIHWTRSVPRDADRLSHPYKNVHSLWFLSPHPHSLDHTLCNQGSSDQSSFLLVVEWSLDVSVTKVELTDLFCFPLAHMRHHPPPPTFHIEITTLQNSYRFNLLFTAFDLKSLILPFITVYAHEPISPLRVEIVSYIQAPFCIIPWYISG